MADKIGPKEAQIRALREAAIKQDNRRLLRGKLKMKAVGQVVNIRTSKGARGK